MSRSPVLATFLLLVVVLVPAAAAQETQTKSYPFVGKDGIGYSTKFHSSCGDCYSDFAITVTDTLPAEVWYRACVITAHQDGRGADEVCGEDPNDPIGDDIEDPRAEGCGSQSLTSPVLAGGTVNTLHVTLRPVFVDGSTGDLCLATTGTVTVTFS